MRGLIVLALFLFVSACHQSRQAPPSHAETTIKPTVAPDIRSSVDQIIFGRFCGECGHDCARMYRYSRRGAAKSLWVDMTDSYLHKKSIEFDTELNDSAKFELAEEIVKHIPSSLLTTDKAVQRFGHPDLTDGCGIYLEISQSGKTKKFAIDYQISQLSGDIKDFAAYFHTAIAKMKQGTP